MSYVKYFLFLSLIIFLVLPNTGCKKPPKPQTPESVMSEENKNNDEQKETAKGKIPRKYGIKSGFVELDIQNNFINVPIKSTLWFDKYGDLEMSEERSEMEMMGQKIITHTRRITRDGFIYTIDMVKKTGTKAKINSFAELNSFDFSKYSEDLLKKWNIKELPEATVLNKKCKVTSFESSSMKGTVYVWQGINLNSEINVSGMEMKSKATKLETNIPVKKDIFEVPADVKIL